MARCRFSGNLASFLNIYNLSMRACFGMQGCKLNGIVITYISTLSTLIPQSAVASSSKCCIAPAMLQTVIFWRCLTYQRWQYLSLSLRISWRFLVPKIFLRDVCARSLVVNTILLNCSFDILLVFLLCAMMSILYIGHAHYGIGDSVVNYCINWYCHTVLCQKLKAKCRTSSLTSKENIFQY